ncbi:MAG: hypothetical protein BWY82_02076 [Verrucomicrobia bacterium ADurb.Bin474]|nr:MAG: hypothetical protein BWY82_02076 [Verrucomicrobia bacterium ADurb.Bin474]
MPDPKQTGDKTVALGLWHHTMACIHQYDRKVTVTGSRSHVPGVLFMAGTIADNEAPLLSREVAVCHVDRYPLLALRLESVGQQGRIKRRIRRAMHLRILHHRRQLVLVNHVGIIQQPPDEGALAVVHASARQEPQHVLLLVPPQIGRHVIADQILLPDLIIGVAHGKMSFRCRCVYSGDQK